MGYVTIKANSAFSNLAHRSVENTGPLFLVGGIFATKVRDCLEPMLPGWQIEILACSFSRDPLSIEKASPLYGSCHSSTLCVSLFFVAHKLNFHINLILICCMTNSSQNNNKVVAIKLLFAVYYRIKLKSCQITCSWT